MVTRNNNIETIENDKREAYNLDAVIVLTWDKLLLNNLTIGQYFNQIKKNLAHYDIVSTTEKRIIFKRRIDV